MIEIQASIKDRKLISKITGTEQEIFAETCMILESYIDQVKENIGEAGAKATTYALIRILNNHLDDTSPIPFASKVTFNPKLVDFISSLKDDSDEEKE